jgi:hypothetical protein
LSCDARSPIASNSSSRSKLIAPILPERQAKPSEALLQKSPELHKAMKKDRTLLDYYKIKFSEENPESQPAAS